MSSLHTKLGDILSNNPHKNLIAIRKPSKNGKFIQAENIFVGYVDGKWIAYDRTCDHNGGILCLSENGKFATCPLHGWKIDLESSYYENGCHKKSLQIIEKESTLEIILDQPLFPEIDKTNLTDADVYFSFNAHASVTVGINEITLTTDPWIIGPCFTTGWWHKYPASTSAGQRVNLSDLIYISHNHPDHLHLDSLREFTRKDQCFLVPNFKSKSVELLLRRNGFNNLIILDFMQELIVEKNGAKLKLVIVDSGDDRDDSSLLIFTKNNVAFFAVDTNMPNSWVLPKCDIAFTSFAGGMSGFPMRIENYDLETKRDFTRNIANTLLHHHVHEVVKSTNAKYIVPYAGYFTYAPRDKDVSLNTPKNTPEEMIDDCQFHFNTIGINPIETGNFVLHANNQLKLLASDDFDPLFFLDEDYFEDEIKKYARYTPNIDRNLLAKLGKDFTESGFSANLSIMLVPTLPNFEILPNKLALYIDFEKNVSSVVKIQSADSKSLASQIRAQTKNNIEILKIREDSLRGSINRGLPLEDLSIGFQINMYREPNVYNFEFWNYFTNHYFINTSCNTPI